MEQALGPTQIISSGSLELRNLIFYHCSVSQNVGRIELVFLWHHPPEDGQYDSNQCDGACIEPLYDRTRTHSQTQLQCTSTFIDFNSTNFLGHTVTWL